LISRTFLLEKVRRPILKLRIFDLGFFLFSMFLCVQIFLKINVIYV